MNILILNWRDPKHPLAGGAEIMLFKHALYWQKKGAHITWVSSFFPGAKKEEYIHSIHVKRFGSQYSVHVLFFLQRIQGNFVNFDKIIDCFHFLPFFTPLLYSKEKIVALIHEVAGSVWFENILFPISLIGYLVEPLFFLLYKNVQFITVSPSTQKELQVFGISQKDIHVVFNGVDGPNTKITYKKTGYPSLLFLNRISKDKGIGDVLMAFKILKQTYPLLRLTIAGREQEKDLIKKILKSCKNPKDVVYEGFVSEKEKWRLLGESWILVHPSVKEGWGLTVIEANTVGTPVVGYKVPGLQDAILHNKTGLLVTPSVQELAKAIAFLLENRKKLSQLSLGAKQWAKNFMWSKATQESWNILHE